MTFLNVVCLEPAELNSNTDTFVYNPNQILKNFKQATAKTYRPRLKYYIVSENHQN